MGLLLCGTMRRGLRSSDTGRGQAGNRGQFAEPWRPTTVAYTGRLKEAREFSRRAVYSAERAGQKETAASYSAVSGLREALFGNAGEARRSATVAMERSTGRDVQYGSALALAYAGDDKQARTLTDDLSKGFPEDTVVLSNYLPTLRAKLALRGEKMLQRPLRFSETRRRMS